MSPKIIVITGASDGVGAAAARELAKRGHELVVVGRNPAKTEAVAREIGAPFEVADFSDLAEVRALAERLAADHPRIDVLANNAGGIMGARTVTADGFERTFQVNHLAPFLLTRLLLPTLRDSGAAVIQTSSAAARAARRIDFGDLQGERRYSPWEAYGRAKLANILFTRELHRRFHGEGLSAAAFHPGVVGSNFAADSGMAARLLYTNPILKRLFTVSNEQGADQLVWLADGREGVDWASGRYYEKRRPVRSAPQAHDAEAARRLWDISDELLGL